MNGPSSGGFTIIETIVAFTILVLGLAALYQGYGVSAQGMAAADARIRAIGRAQSKLAETGVTGPLVEGRTEGLHADDGSPWTVTVKRRAHPPSQENALASRAYEVTVEIAWGRLPHRRSFRLDSIKLATGS